MRTLVAHLTEAALVTRVALDQLCFAPTFMAIFFIAAGVMEGLDRETILAKLKMVRRAFDGDV